MQSWRGFSFPLKLFGDTPVGGASNWVLGGTACQFSLACSGVLFAETTMNLLSVFREQ